MAGGRIVMQGGKKRARRRAGQSGMLQDGCVDCVILFRGAHIGRTLEYTNRHGGTVLGASTACLDWFPWEME